jgi:hypothetical protein
MTCDLPREDERSEVFTLPDDVQRLIAECIVRADRPIASCAADCAALAMSCKALRAMSSHAWEKCAALAECQPPLRVLAARWNCVCRGAMRQHVYGLVSVKLRGSRSMPAHVLDTWLERQPGTVGDSCPIPWKAARFLLDVSWLAITFDKASQRFWDRNLDQCEYVTNNTLRFSSALAAPLKDTTEDVKYLVERMASLKQQSGAMLAQGAQRQWGDTDIDVIEKVVAMRKWATDVGLSPTMVTSLDAHVRMCKVFDAELRADALRYVELMCQWGCTEHFDGHVTNSLHHDVRGALSIGIQKQRLGSQMFFTWAVFNDAETRGRGRVTDADVIALDASMELVQACVKCAEPAALTACMYVNNPTHYITAVTNATSRIRAKRTVSMYCSEAGVSGMVEAAALTALDNGDSLMAVICQIDAIADAFK